MIVKNKSQLSALITLSPTERFDFPHPSWTCQATAIEINGRSRYVIYHRVLKDGTLGDVPFSKYLYTEQQKAAIPQDLTDKIDQIIAFMDRQQIELADALAKLSDS